MKKRKMRVIQISGIRGVISAIFVGMCLVAGFVGFPAWAITNLWNNFLANAGMLPFINLFQGLVLWGILAVGYMILNQKQRYLMAFESRTPSSAEIKKILNEIKTQESGREIEIDSSRCKPKTDVAVHNDEEETKEVV